MKHCGATTKVDVASLSSIRPSWRGGVLENIRETKNCTFVGVLVQAINLDGSSTEAYYLRGLALYLTQNLDQSKKHFQEALRLNPDHTKSQLAFKRVRNIERTLETAKECMEVRVRV